MRMCVCAALQGDKHSACVQHVQGDKQSPCELLSRTQIASDMGIIQKRLYMVAMEVAPDVRDEAIAPYQRLRNQQEQRYMHGHL